jgi:hypothetical protein
MRERLQSERLLETLLVLDHPYSNAADVLRKDKTVRDKPQRSHTLKSKVIKTQKGSVQEFCPGEMQRVVTQMEKADVAQFGGSQFGARRSVSRWLSTHPAVEADALPR